MGQYVIEYACRYGIDDYVVCYHKFKKIPSLENIIANKCLYDIEGLLAYQNYPTFYDGVHWTELGLEPYELKKLMKSKWNIE